MAKKIKIQLNKEKILLPLNISQGGIRIADEYGNHVSKPTKIKNESKYLIEWMITNDENKFLVDSFLNINSIKNLIKRMSGIKRFAEESNIQKGKL